MQQPKVSIIVPCWGVEKYLDKCVESIVNQTLHDIEIILVDDVSPDRVPEMCDAWAQKDSRIKVIHKSMNEGLGMACNTGIDAATGEYIAFCDSDDWVDTEMYETMYNAAINYSTQVVYTGLRRVNTDGNKHSNLAHKHCFHLYEQRDEIDSFACDMIASAPELAEERTIQMSAKAVLYHLELIRTNNVRFISERQVISEDLHFNLNILGHADRVCVLPTHFYNYRVTPGSITQKIDIHRFEAYKRLYLHTIQEADELKILPLAKNRIQRMIIGYTRNYIRIVSRSNLDFRQKIDAISKTLRDPIWDSIWREYPYSRVPLQHKFIHFLMMRKFTFCLFLALKYK